MIADNRKAHHDYFLFDKFEAGIELKGSEVKSIRDGRATLKDSYVRVVGNQIFVVNLHISTYRYTHDFVPDPTRARRLLLNRREIGRIIEELGRKGLVCIPLRLYLKRGFIKLEIALGKKKKAFDKREVLRKKIADREVDKAVKYALHKRQ